MLSLLVAVPVLSVSIPVRATHKEALLGAGAVGGVFAELFCIKSLLTFDPVQPPTGAIDTASQPKWNIAHVSAGCPFSLCRMFIVRSLFTVTVGCDCCDGGPVMERTGAASLMPSD